MNVRHVVGDPRRLLARKRDRCTVHECSLKTRLDNITKVCSLSFMYMTRARFRTSMLHSSSISLGSSQRHRLQQWLQDPYAAGVCGRWHRDRLKHDQYELRLNDCSARLHRNHHRMPAESINRAVKNIQKLKLYDHDLLSSHHTPNREAEQTTNHTKNTTAPSSNPTTSSTLSQTPHHPK